MADSEFWLALDRLVATSNLIIDRPKGSPHPRHATFRYPMDYGYLQGTKSPDGYGIDVWIGSLKVQSPAAHTVTGIIAAVDADKRDAEFKLLLNCTPAEAQIAFAAHNRGLQTGILVKRSDTGENHAHD
jgi:inorganic pyrophosphatase